jgi:hypothetical protein
MDGDDAYKLVIIKADASGKAVYTPKEGDSYVLTITYKDKTKEPAKSSGTVTIVSDGFELTPSNSEIKFTVKIKGTLMTGITGTITLEDDTTEAVTEDFVPCKTYDAFTLTTQRWSNDGGTGEEWINTIDLSEFTARIPKKDEVLKFNISGTTDIPVEWFTIYIACYTDNWVDFLYLGDADSVSLSETFEKTIDVPIWNDPLPKAHFYVGLKNVLWTKYPEGNYSVNNGKTIPPDTPHGTPMATISNFRVKFLPE